MVNLSVINNEFYNANAKALELKQNGMTIKLNYLYGRQTSFKPADKYWAQLQVGPGFTENIFKLMRAAGNHSPTEVVKSLEYLIGNMPQFWSTYKQNFLAGQVLYTFTQIKTALVHSALPEVLGTSMFWAFAKWDETANVHYLTGRDFSNYLENILLIIGPNTPIGKAILNYVQDNYPQYYDIAKKVLELVQTTGKQFLDEFVCEIFPDLDRHVTWPEYSEKAQQIIRDWANLNSLIFQIPVHIQGYQYGEYGIGLGEFFIAIAMWVGVLMQTFIFDRTCRTKRAKWYQHYFSKLLLMLITTAIQTTILAISLAILGYSKMGPSFGLLYVWLLLCSLIFTIIEHAIWFAPADGDVGKYLIVIYLILNLTAGWGTFPSFMQAGFFNVISVLTPFKYAIHGMGNIIYGIGTGEGSLVQYQTEILQNMGILLIWIPILLIISLGLTYLWRQKEQYGTFNLKALKKVLPEENININKNVYRTLNGLSNQEVEIVKRQILINQYQIFEEQKSQKIKRMETKFDITKNPKYLYKIKKIKAKGYSIETEEEDRDSIV
ncbi:ABC transporter permease [Spiroplasma poulsonii]|uniref:ABC-2 family transporter protein n=1 Tax=Spiroplasma poulsonii TaxID=2138 RepID=A0A2P6FA86_9MOLU|nr:ABC transporter permease [Spiroplasma poulsonii]KAF0852022.1 ABC-2 family transporter protein [Spiroplasma poulsonii]PQM30375.1 ABC-2 family transporter protein [Spiroplasma poulsonii]PWF95343.1 ABC-2 family transporter protein [Spiroplasma poulsonii]PWF98129.1 ABC-2 family transporter protein [Spiroplasma poulsonii]